MAKYRRTPEGKVVGFPDDMSDEEITSVFKKQFPATNPITDFLRNVGAGALQGVKSTAESAIQPSTLVGINLPEQINKGFEQVDPYKLMGTEKAQEFLSPQGLEQALGEFGPLIPSGIKAAKSGISLFKPGSHVREIMNDISGGQSLEENAQKFASHAKNIYQKIKSEASKAYEDIFKERNIGSKEVNIDPYKKLDEKTFDFSDPELIEKHEEVIKNPTIKKLHDYQSDLGAEDRWYERKESRPDGLTREEKKDWYNIKKARSSIKDLIKENLGKDLALKYEEAGENWATKVMPWESDRSLRKIVKGKTTNPSPSEVKGIFQYAEPDIKNISAELGPLGRNTLLYQSIGKQLKNILPKDLTVTIQKMEDKGFEPYVTKELQDYLATTKSKMRNKKIAENIAKYGVGVLGTAYGVKKLGELGYKSLVEK